MASTFLAPGFLRCLEEEALDELVALLSFVEQRLIFPAQAMLVKVAMVPKPQGGDRPISLLWMLYRLLCFCRKGEVTAWDEAAAGPWDSAVKGRSALDAVYSSEVSLEMAAFYDSSVVGAWVDAEKFYDGIDLALLMQDAMDLKYPSALLGLAMELCLSPRIVTHKGSCADSILVSNSLIAGCMQAVSLARCFLHNVMSEVCNAAPHSKAREFVDDVVSITITKTKKAAIKEGCRVIELLFRLLTAKKVRISPKTTILASSRHIAEPVVEHLANKGFPVVMGTHCRDLGVDSAAGRRRVNKTVAKRAVKARKRAGRAATLVKACKGARLCRSGALAQAKWGTELRGLAPSTLKSLKAAAATVALPTAAGASPTVATWTTFGPLGDPELVMPLGLLKQWILWLNNNYDRRDELVGLWNFLVERLRDPATRWARVKGPVAAVVATLYHIRWTPVTPASWLDEAGQLWRIEGKARPSPLAAVLQAIKDSLAHGIWTAAAANEGLRGAEFGIEEQHAFKALRQRNKKDDGDGLLRFAMADALWFEDRRHKAGYRKRPSCRRCGLAAETWRHCLWECQANDGLADEAVYSTNPFKPEASLEHESVFWVHGLLPRGWLSVAEKPPLSFVVPGEDGHHPRAAQQESDWLLAATDGSGGPFACNRWLRACGWGFVLFEGSTLSTFTLRLGKFGNLPNGPQTVPRAEAEAIRQVLLEVDPGVNLRVFTDHKNLVTSIKKGSEALVSSLASSREPANADLLLDIFDLLAARTGAFDIAHVRSHADAAVVLQADVPVTSFVANEIADAYASRGSRLGGPTGEEENRVNRLLEFSEQIHRRMETIAKVMKTIPLDPSNVQVPVREEVKKPTLRALWRATEHRAVPAGPGRYRCLSCFGVSRKRRLATWFGSQCPRINSGGPEGSPHETHTLETHGGSLLWCQSCGVYGSHFKFRRLSRPCPGHPTSRWHRSNLGRLRQDIAPAGSHRSSLADELELV